MFTSEIPIQKLVGAPPQCRCREERRGRHRPSEPLATARPLVGLRCRPPPAMETSKMLPMEPEAAVALLRALLWQISCVFITPDSQHGTSLSDSMALRCGAWRSRQRGAVAACTVAVRRCSLQLTMWSCGRGSQGRISSSSFSRCLSFAVQNAGEYFNAAAAGRASCRGARSAAALCVRRLLHPKVLSLRLEHSSHALPLAL